MALGIGLFLSLFSPRSSSRLKHPSYFQALIEKVHCDRVDLEASRCNIKADEDVHPHLDLSDLHMV